jgi:acetyl esterase/lipase
MSEDVLTRPPPPADARFRYGPAPSQFAELRVPRSPGPHPVVICLHGGFWRVQYDLAHLGHLCAALTARGFATWNLEYRRLGEEGGGWPGTFDDVTHGAAKLRAVAAEHSLDLQRVATLGHSAGGHLALWLAKTFRPLRGVVPLAPVADLEEAARLGLSGGVAAEFRGHGTLAQTSPKQLLPLGVRQLLIHGEADEIVPIEISRSYVKSARTVGDDAELVALAGLAHFEPIDPESNAFPHVLAAVEALLR